VFGSAAGDDESTDADVVACLHEQASGKVDGL
jgi:hypothetical protein